MTRKINLVDLALLLLSLAVAAALVIHVAVPSPLRRAVVDEAERRPVEVEVRSDSTFLAGVMTPGDAQTMAHGTPGIELLEYRLEGGKIVARFRVQARKWRGRLQYGESTLVPGETFEFLADRYKLVGTITHVAP
ncbi:MAG: hypothetical protein HYY17_00300 [Planctomycetes bacterium]|nr:hypothetical protein [Planctomycetota bacterium]